MFRFSGPLKKELSLPGWFQAVVRIACLFGAILSSAYLFIVYPLPSLTATQRFWLLYNAPIYGLFFFWLYCRTHERDSFRVGEIVTDGFVVCLALSRFLGPLIPPSGHALFLSYSLLTTGNRLYRIVAAVLLALTIALKLSWGDYHSWLYGILLGVVFAVLHKIVRV
jgi:hypothetical protein